MVEVGGERRKAWEFLLRLMYSGREFAWLHGHCDQLAFLDGHVRAFAYLGGVARRCAYDNLAAAVRKIVGARREFTGRFLALVSPLSISTAIVCRVGTFALATVYTMLTPSIGSA